MAAKYPFTTGEELKQYVSGIDIDIDIENINSSLIRASRNIIDLVTKEVYTLAINHYNDETNYNQPGQTDPNYIRLDNLVAHVQEPLAAFAMYHHFIWLRLRINNNSVTVVKNDNEDRPFKYEIDEAKEELLQLAWIGITELYDFLNEEATNFPDWDNSEQKSELESLIFTDYKDFNKHFGTENNAVFFMMARYKIEEITTDEILSRFETVADIPANLLTKCKKAVAYRTVADACNTFNYEYLPPPIRTRIAEDGRKKSTTEEFTRTKLRNNYNITADNYLAEIDINIETEKQAADTDITAIEIEDYKQDENKPYASIL